jgi:membrane protein YdbS with pleckstrin-like domain
MTAADEPAPDATTPADTAPVPAPPPREPVPAPVGDIDADSGWQPLPRAARGVRMATGATFGLVQGLVLWVAVALVGGIGFVAKVLLLPVFLVAAVAFGAWIGLRRWASTQWRLDARGLQVRRGRMFQREVLVPRSRVQHLDLERGPIERHYGLATIVVHTAGSRLQALRQSGLAEADAVALRDALVPDADVDDDAV